jgi:hypothetical protein
MTINIIPGARWGRRPWAEPIHAVPTTERQHFLVHYDGAPLSLVLAKPSRKPSTKSITATAGLALATTSWSTKQATSTRAAAGTGRSALPQLQPQWHRRASGDWWISGAV